MLIQEFEDLEEMCFGELEGKYVGSGPDSWASQIAEVTAKWTEGHEDVAFPQGESPAQVKERAFRCLRSIVDENRFDCGLLVTHGRFLCFNDWNSKPPLF